MMREAAGVARSRMGLARLSAPQTRVAERNTAALSSLITWAVDKSPFYRRLYVELGDPRTLALEQLPVVTKAMMMDHLDAFLTDPALDRAELERRVDLGRAIAPDGYRTIVTSGSTGLRGLFAFDQQEWNTMLASFWRWTDMVGMTPRPWRRRIAVIAAPSPLHFSNNMASSISPYRMLYVHSGTAIPDVCRQLDAFQPDFVLSYPSVCAQLAQEQVRGRLHIRPRRIATSGELRTVRMEETIREAWGMRALDMYAMTEVGLVAGQCPEAGGLHHFNDLSIIEVVDERNQPVEAGTAGAKILVTNLFLRTQPLIRYEVSDLLTMDARDCPCGRTWPLIGSVTGRMDDLLWFPDQSGRQVQVHPLQLQSLILAQTGVAAYQICQERDRLLILVVPDRAVDLDALLVRLQGQVLRKLDKLRILPQRVEVVAVDAIARQDGPGGKIKLVKSFRSGPEPDG